MTQLASLIVALDPRRYVEGARKVDQASRKVKASAADTTGGVDKLSKSFVGAKTNMLLLGGAGFLVARQLGQLSRAVFDNAKGMVDLASAQAEIDSKFQAVFKETAPGARAELDRFADSLGLSSAAMRGQAAELQDILVPMGIARDEAAKLSVQMVELATDVGSFNDKSRADVVANFASAIVGVTQAVRSYGIDLSVASVKQEALRLGIADGTRELTTQEKVLARVSLLSRSTADAHGDFARTSDQFANTMRQLNEQIDDQKRLLGSGLIEDVLDFGRALGGVGGASSLTSVGLTAVAETAGLALDVLTPFASMLNQTIENMGGAEVASERLARASETLASGFEDTLRSYKAFVNVASADNPLEVIGRSQNTFASLKALREFQTELQKASDALARDGDAEAYAAAIALLPVSVGQASASLGIFTDDAALEAAKFQNQWRRAMEALENDAAAGAESAASSVGEASDSMAQRAGNLAHELNKPYVEAARTARTYKDIVLGIEDAVTEAIRKAADQRSDARRKEQALAFDFTAQRRGLIGDIIDGNRQLTDSLDLQLVAIQSNRDAFADQINQQVFAGQVTVDQAGELQRLAGIYFDLQDKIAGVNDELRKNRGLFQASSTAIDGIAQAAGNAAVGFGGFGDQVRGTAQRVISDLIATQAQTILLKLAFQALTNGGSGGLLSAGAFNKFFGTAFGGKGVAKDLTGVASTKTNANGLLPSNIQSFGNGGSPAGFISSPTAFSLGAGTLGIAGERGKEVGFRSDSTVFPIVKTASGRAGIEAVGGGGGGGIGTVNIVLNGVTDASGFDRSRAQLLRELEQFTQSQGN